MLTPTGNIQDWIDNQNKQVRAESNITIAIYNVVNGALSFLTEIDKFNLESFSIRESSPALCFSVPQTNINFTVFKNGNIENLITKGCLINIFYEYKQENGWQFCDKGLYEISKTTVENNGLIARYEARTLRYQTLEQIYKKGCPEGGSTGSGWIDVAISLARAMDSNLLSSKIGYNNLFTDGVCASKMNDRSVMAIISSVAQASGCRFRVKGGINNTRYELYFEFMSNSSITTNQNYIVEYLNLLKKPEYIESNYKYVNGYEITEYIENYYFDSHVPESPYSEDDRVYITLPSGYVNSGFNEYDMPKVPFDHYNSPISGKPFVIYDGNGNDVSQNYTMNIDIYGKGFEIITNPSIPNEYTVKINYYGLKDVSNRTIKADVGVGDNKLVINNPFVCSRLNTYRDSGSPSHQVLYKLMNSLNALIGKDELEIECRFDPRIEVGDCIIVADSPTTYRKCLLESYNMTFNGSFKGKMELIDLGSSTRVIATFHTYQGGVGDTQELWSGETPSTTYVPSFSASNNAVYSAKVFTGWSPSLAPITENTDYTPTFDPTYRVYEELNYSSMPTATFNAQIVGWTTRSLSIGYIATPHIAHIFALKNSHPLTIPAKEGEGVGYISSFPTTFSGGVGKDEWQDNRIIITQDATLNKWVIRNRRRTTRETLYTLAKKSNGQLYFATNEQITNLNLEIISGDTIDDLWDRFSYDASNDCFLVDSQDSGDIVRLYKEQTQ